jgi:predicted AlkP superfamily phosphohydrolase/phosphomutase
MTKRVLVVGLDCAPPRLVFDQFASAMPTLRRLRATGAWGPLRSVVPPITVPAWACATTGRDAGEMGLYGFRNRPSREYALTTSTSEGQPFPHIWDLAAEAGLRAASLFVPPSYPIRSAHPNVTQVSCMLAPGADVVHTHPASLGAKLSARVGPYISDLERTLEGDAALDGLHRMAAQHFDIAEIILRDEDPHLLFMVEIGTDRLHHLFYPAMDSADPRHAAFTALHPNWMRRARDYYSYLDMRLGKLLALSGPETDVIVMSDHGARPLLGGVFINEWLRSEGLLVLKDEPSSERPLRIEDIDWSRTKAWSEGGYYARIFLNVRGREPLGVIAPEDVEGEMVRLEAALSALPDVSGRGHRIVRAREAFRAQNGGAPDLLVFFGDLALRSLGAVGGGAFTASPERVERDKGRGGCNHDWEGICVLQGRGVRRRGPLEGASLMDIGRTVLDLLGVQAPSEMQGKSLVAQGDS